MDKPPVTPPFKQVRILGKRHRVIWNEKLEDEGCGEFRPPTLQIHIAAGLNHDEERETMLHELLHAVAFQVGAEVPEVKHRPLSVALYAAFKDNPKLVAYLFQEEPDDA